MLRRKNSVVFLAAHTDACALWRLFMPHVAIRESGFFYFEQKPDWSKIAAFDTVVVQRLCTNAQLEFLRVCAGLGMRIIYDLDDNVWEIPEYNPAHRTLNAYREGFNACIRMVHAVSVSTRELAASVRKHVGKKQMTHLTTGMDIPIVVVENRIEERLFARPVQPNSLLVGWAGSSSHIGDLVLVEDAIVACSREFPQTTFQFRGCVLAEDSKIRNVQGFQHVLWTPVAEYAARMPVWGWSIALAPVQDIRFNAAKSCIKMIEAGYCGIPCLASWVRPYEEFCFHDKELQWLLCRTPGEFMRKLRVLLNEPERREDLGRRMRTVVDEHYSFNRPHDGWEKVLEMARC